MYAHVPFQKAQDQGQVGSASVKSYWHFLCRKAHKAQQEQYFGTYDACLGLRQTCVYLPGLSKGMGERGFSYRAGALQLGDDVRKAKQLLMTGHGGNSSDLN